MKQLTKCYSVNLTEEQIQTLKHIKQKSKKTQSHILMEAVHSGLQQQNLFIAGKMLFLVKVRINTDLIMELGQKLETGELDTTMIIFTYCIKEDPTVGISMWIVDNKEHFEEMFSHHKKYYKEVIDIQEVILPDESMKIILANNQ